MTSNRAFRQQGRAQATFQSCSTYLAFGSLDARAMMQPAGQALTEADWDPHTFNPFEVDYGGRAGYCLLTLQIAVWALHWSKSDEPFPVPAGFPAEVFQKRGAWTIAWPGMVGQDSDTYGSVGGAAIAAAHADVPEAMTEKLSALEGFDRLIHE